MVSTSASHEGLMVVRNWQALRNQAIRVGQHLMLMLLFVVVVVVVVVVVFVAVVVMPV